MKKHQIAAIVGGVILSLVSFLPVLVTMKDGLRLSHPKIVGVFMYPTLGVAVAAVIVFIAFLKNRDD